MYRSRSCHCIFYHQMRKCFLSIGSNIHITVRLYIIYKNIKIYRMAAEYNISEKVKDYLRRKLNDCRKQLIKLKRKRKMIKILYVSTVVSSIIISTVAAKLTSMISVPIIVIIVLSA